MASLKEVREVRLISVISLEMFSRDFPKPATTTLTTSVVVGTARSPKASHAPRRGAASIPSTPQAPPSPQRQQQQQQSQKAWGPSGCMVSITWHTKNTPPKQPFWHMYLVIPCAHEI